MYLIRYARTDSITHPYLPISIYKLELLFNCHIYYIHPNMTSPKNTHYKLYSYKRCTVYTYREWLLYFFTDMYCFVTTKE